MGSKYSDFDDLRRLKSLKAVSKQLSLRLPSSLGSSLGLRRLDNIPFGDMNPDWVVKSFIESDTTTLVVAPPNSFKSFFIVSCTVNIAAGKDWNGLEVKRSRPVVIVNGEGNSGYTRRLYAALKHQKIEADKLPIYCSDRPLDLLGNHRELIVELKKMDIEPGVLVFDTLSRNAPGADENSAKDMSTIIRNLDEIRKEYGCAVLIVHHTPLGDKTRGRGSSAIFGAMDAQFSLAADTYLKRVTISCAKFKDHEPPAPMHLRGITVGLGVTDEDGNELTSLAFESTSALPPIKLGKNQQLFLDTAKSLLVNTEESKWLAIKEIMKVASLKPNRKTEIVNALCDRAMIKVKGDKCRIL